MSIIPDSANIAPSATCAGRSSSANPGLRDFAIAATIAGSGRVENLLTARRHRRGAPLARIGPRADVTRRPARPASVPPALIAGLTLYGLVADPQTVARQMQTLAEALPREAQPLIADQLHAVASGSNGALGIGLVVSVLAALWSASSGTSNLMSAINLAYDKQENRGFLKLRAVALALTLGAIIFMLLTLFLIAAVPPLLATLQLGIVSTILAQIVRWALLVALVIAALAIVYRLAPDRNAPQFAWTSPGAIVATVLWVLGSVYVNNFGSYNKTYGALAGVIVFLLWHYLTSYIVLLGAEINAESEKQTAVDTTIGDPMQMG